MTADPNWHNRKCRDCDHRVKDSDPTNLAFQGLSHCRANPPNLIFIAGMGGDNRAMAQPLGSNYPIVDDNTGACRLFEPNEGNIRRNVIKIPVAPPPGRQPVTLP